MSGPNFKDAPSPSSIKREMGSTRPHDISANEGAQRYALGYAMIVKIDYKQLTCLIRVETGETFTSEIPLSFPGAGNRHFFGALPEPGDVCVIGWKARESGVTREAIILTWQVPGVQAGYQWMPTQPYSPDEYDQTPSDRIRQEGIADRIRHKLRHMEPGNIVASSSQGSDLVLDESATLSNRRANEIRLRDSDQAMVFRSLQQFHAGAGFRIYGGMVQRDATLLPNQMFSGERDWASLKLLDDDGEPLKASDLTATTSGALSPNPVFDLLDFDPDVDPNSFLQRGMFITNGGSRREAGVPSTGVYGGKLVYRLTDDPANFNAFRSTEADALTEYRIEVAHTSDGTLPVTEQTDNFDADRLPGADPSSADTDVSSGATPFIEVVYGTVVGNDPYSLQGREFYAKPLSPSIFGEGPDPAPGFSAGSASSIDNHAAMLFKMKPPSGAGSDPTWWSVTKTGRFMASIAGPSGTTSVEAAVARGVHAWAGSSPKGESFRLEGAGAFIVDTQGGRNEDNLGVSLSTTGAMLLSAAGTSNVGRGTVNQGEQTGEGEADQPSMTLDGGPLMRIKANTVQIKAPKFDLSGVDSMVLKASSIMDFSSGTMFRAVSGNVELNATNDMKVSVSGPKDSKPTNGPYMTETITTTLPTTGVVKKTEVDMGKTQHVTYIGDVEVKTKVGDVLNRTTTGTVQNKAGQNEWTTKTASGLTGRATVGAVSVKALAGSMTISGSVSAMLSATGPATVKGTAGVTLIGPGKKGLMLCSTDRDPLTGQLFSLYGMGSPGHRLG